MPFAAYHLPLFTEAIIAEKLEKPRSNEEKWDIHQLEPGPDGHLRYVSQ